MPNSLQSSDSGNHIQGTSRAPSLFGSMPADAQQKLRDGATRRNFADGQLIAQRGDSPDGFWIIVNGWAKAGHNDGDGEMQALILLGPGSSFGELACLGGFNRVVDIEAMGELETLWVSERQLRAILNASPDLSQSLLRTMAAQLQDAVNGLFEIRNVPAPKRLARRLLLLARGRKAPVKLTIRQQELAELVGVSRMTVGQVLTQLEREDIVSRHYGHIVVKDIDRLRRWMRR